ncbi:MAG: hypothetical protein OXI80_00300 [Caldilineaceae bacterium]|nr:hypothetical protein [Caldilineaceae bacterium]MDE0336082.1 hypothetical protein [Caldilineaceae bacterium]
MERHLGGEQDKRVPALADVREIANALHLRNKPYQGHMWEWPVFYEPELVEEDALFDLPDIDDGMKQEQRSHYSPASFTAGESGIWFFSLLWENGRDAEPVEFLDVVPFEETNFDATAPTAVAAS